MAPRRRPTRQVRTGGIRDAICDVFSGVGGVEGGRYVGIHVE